MLTTRMLPVRGAAPAGDDRRMQSIAPSPKRSWPRRIFGVFNRRRTYLNLLYNGLAFPLGVAYFVALVTLIATGAGMAVTVVGLPLLVLTIYGWCWIADTDRLLTNALLGTRIRPLSFESERGMSWGLSRLWVRLRNPATWRAGLYLFLRFPQGTAVMAVIGGLLAQAAWGVALPFVYASLGPDASQQYGSVSYGVFTIDSLGEALVVTAFSPLCLLLAIHLSDLFAWVSGKAAAVLFGGEGELPPRAALNPALASTVHWPGIVSPAAHTPARTRIRHLQTRAILWHAGAFGALTVLFLAVTAAATPGEWWAAWPVWGIAIPLGIHFGYYLRGGWGAHAGLFAVIMLGLFFIDMRFGHNVWFYWPLLGWGVVLLLHWWLSRKVGIEREREVAYLHAAPVEADASPPPLVQSGPDDGVEEAPSTPPETPPAHAPGISVDVAMRIVRVGGQEVDVTRREFDLLALFASNPGRPFGRDELLDRIWKNDYDVTERTIDTHIQRLRRKLGDHADAIQTVWGVGYRFVRDEDSAPN